MLDKIPATKKKTKTKTKTPVTFYFAEQIISTDTYWPIKNKGGYLFMPFIYVDVRGYINKEKKKSLDYCYSNI